MTPASKPQSNERGYVVVLTGDGKGKTTSALGMAMRACGHGLRVAFLQFLKSGDSYGECVSAKSVPGLEMQALGLGCVGMPGDKLSRSEHAAAAASALSLARTKALAGECDMLVLDEVNVAVSLGLVAVEDVLSLIDRKPARLHIVLTGRNAPSQVTDRADLVTDMRMVKHPYYEGKRPIEGIEY